MSPVRQLLLFRTGCHALPVELGGDGRVAGAGRACMLCGRCPGDGLYLVLQCAGPEG